MSHRSFRDVVAWGETIFCKNGRGREGRFGERAEREGKKRSEEGGEEEWGEREGGGKGRKKDGKKRKKVKKGGREREEGKGRREGGEASTESTSAPYWSAGESPRWVSMESHTSSINLLEHRCSASLQSL